MDKNTTISLASPNIVPGEALSIFGLSQPHKGSNAGMPAQWTKFLPYFGHIAGQIGNVAYGVIYNCDNASNCDYMCGVAVKEFPSHPPEFARLQIPPQTYAVFEHRDHISAIASTWEAIWEHGLVGAGCQAADGPAFERYGQQFDSRTGLGGLEIWVPVRS